MTYKIDMTATAPQDFDDTTPATDEALADEFYGEVEVHYDDLPQWLEEDAEYPTRRDEKAHACAFCKREGSDSPAEGSYATGSYYRDRGHGFERPQPFRGHVCDSHRDDIDWVSFKWAN